MHGNTKIKWIHHFELQTKSEWNGTAQLLLGSHRFSRGTNGHCFLVGRMDAEGVILVDIMQTIHSDLYKLLKPCRSVSGEFSLTKVLLKSSNTTTKDHTHV